MPEGFQFPGGSGTVLQIFTPAPAEVWVPLVLDAETLRQRSSHSLNVIARLKPDVSVAQATSEMDAIQQRIEQQYPTFFVGSNVKIVPLTEQVIGSVRRPVLILWGAVVLVLLIGCANIANLMLVRSASRRKDIAVRAALGARRQRTAAVSGVALSEWAPSDDATGGDDRCRRRRPKPPRRRGCNCVPVQSWSSRRATPSAPVRWLTAPAQQADSTQSIRRPTRGPPSMVRT